MATVKTYRCLRDGQKIGDDVRMFGDFMPEAAQFENLRSYLNAGFLEEIYVEEEVIENWKKERAERPSVADADEEIIETEVTPAEVIEKPKKKTVKKKAIKKTVKTKENDDAKRLAEQEV